MYTTSFDLPTGGTLPTALSLDAVKNLASVRLNGHALGVAWCASWRLAIPTGALKPTANRLEVTVANLWINRLIGDSGKPQAQHLTVTTGNDYTPSSPLESSGLLGPLILLKQNNNEPK